MSANPQVTDVDLDDYEYVCELDQLPAVGAALAVVDGQRVAIVRDGDGHVHAVDDTCSHANVSLAEGDVEGCTIECWLHGSRFDLVTGQPTGLPAILPISVFPVHIEAGTQVWVGINPQR